MRGCLIFFCCHVNCKPPASENGPGNHFNLLAIEPNALGNGIAKMSNSQAIRHGSSCREEISLGSFTAFGRVARARVGFRFLSKRKILASRLLQKFSFSPPVVERDPCAYEEHYHDHRN